jgi:hypothetical protein
MFFPSCQNLSIYLPNSWWGVFNVFEKKSKISLELANYWRCSNQATNSVENKQTIVFRGALA